MTLGVRANVDILGMSLPITQEMCSKPNLSSYGEIAEETRAQAGTWSQIDMYARHTRGNHQLLVDVDCGIRRQRPLVQWPGGNGKKCACRHPP